MNPSGPQSRDWPLRQRFGNGAGRLLIAADPAWSPPPPRITWTHTWRDARSQGGVAVLGGGVRLLATAALVAALVWTGVSAIERDRSADDLLVVRFPTPEPPAEAAPLPPPPLPEPVQLEPVQMARLELPRPAPVRVEPPPPAATPARRATPAPSATPPPAARATPPPAARRRAPPRLEIDPLPAAPAPVELAPAPEPRLPQPVLAKRPGPPAHVVIDPLAQPRSFAAAAPPSARRIVRAAAPETPRSSRPSVAFAAADPGPWRESNVPAAPAPPAARSARAAPQRAERRAAPPAGLVPVHAQAPVQLAAATLAPASRAARAQPQVARSTARHDGADGLEAVPLSALDACVSDRTEDELKLAVVAALGSRDRCVSSAGGYRFVETKNLNAFLMWIERAPTRWHADRCVELQLALECLRGRG